MNKLWRLWLTAILSVLVLTACGGTDNNAKKQSDNGQTTETGSGSEKNSVTYPLTVTDASGKEMTLDKAPETIISTVPSNTEILYALGLEQEITAVDNYSDYPKEAKEKEKIGDMNLNVEKIISLNPDVVFGHEMGLSTGEEGYQQIRDAGIPVYIVKNAGNFQETYDSIDAIGLATGKSVEAKKIIEDMKTKVQNIATKTKNVKEKKKVFVETSDAPEIYAPGKNTFIQEILDTIGAENTVTEEGWIMISPETIVEQNPDVIVAMHGEENIVDSIKKRDGFSGITAVKENKVFRVDENMTSRPGPRLVDGLEEIAKVVYPEAFQ